MATKPVVVFDGLCNFCVTAVKLIRILDRHALLGFLPYQMIMDPTKFKDLSSTEGLVGQMYLILGDGKLVSGTTAISEICSFLSPIGFLCRIFRISPFQRLYAWFAGKRYQVFGCRQSCFLIGKSFDHDSDSIRILKEHLMTSRAKS